MSDVVSNVVDFVQAEKNDEFLVPSNVEIVDITNAVVADDCNSSYTVSPVKAISPAENNEAVPSSSTPSTSKIVDRNAIDLPASLIPDAISPREAEYLIQNAYMAYTAAEKASNCRIHAEASGTNCEKLLSVNKDLKTYITKLQNQQKVLRSEKTEAQQNGIETKAKYDELKVQYTAVVEQGLNAKSVFDEAQKWRENYEKSQAVLLEITFAYKASQERYKESVKLASMFAEERDSTKNDLFVLADFISTKCTDIPNEISVILKKAKLNAVTTVAIANNPPPSQHHVIDKAAPSHGFRGLDTAMECALTNLNFELRSPSPTFILPQPSPAKRRIAHQTVRPAAKADPTRMSTRSRRKSDDDVSIASSTSSRRSARLAKKGGFDESVVYPPEKKGRGRKRKAVSPESRPDMPPPPLPMPRSRRRGKASSPIPVESPSPVKTRSMVTAEDLTKELMTSDDDTSVVCSPVKNLSLEGVTKEVSLTTQLLAEDMAKEVMTSEDEASVMGSPGKALSESSSPQKSVSFDDMPTSDIFLARTTRASTSVGGATKPVKSSQSQQNSILARDLNMLTSDDDDDADKRVPDVPVSNPKVDVVAQDLEMSDTDEEHDAPSANVDSSVAPIADNSDVNEPIAVEINVVAPKRKKTVSPTIEKPSASENTFSKVTLPVASAKKPSASVEPKSPEVAASIEKPANHKSPIAPPCSRPSTLSGLSNPGARLTVPPKKTILSNKPAVPPKQPQQFESADDFFTSILSDAKSLSTKPKPLVGKPTVPITAKPVKPVKNVAPALQKTSIIGSKNKDTLISEKNTAARFDEVMLSESSSDEEESNVEKLVPISTVPSTSTQLPAIVKSISPLKQTTLLGRISAKKKNASNVIQSVVPQRMNRADAARAAAKTALPPTTVSTVNTNVTSETSSAPSIHGRKTLSIREQQKLMQERRTVIMEQLKAEKNKLIQPTPLPKNPTTSRAPPKKTAIAANKASELGELGASSSSKGTKPSESVVAGPSDADEPSSSIVIPSSRPARIAHASSSHGPGLRDALSKPGSTMAQVMTSLSRQSKQRIAGTGPKTRVASVVISVEGAPVPKKRGRKSNAEKAAITNAADSAPNDTTAEVVDESLQSAPRTRSQNRNEDSESFAPPPAKKTKPSESVAPPQPESCSTSSPVKASEAIVLDAKGLFSRVAVDSVDDMLASFVINGPTKISTDELAENALDGAMNLDSKNLFANLDPDKREVDAVLSPCEERYLQLVNELEQSFPGFTKKVFVALAKKQLLLFKQMPMLTINRNYRLLFVLMQFIEQTDLGISPQNLSLIDTLLDHLVLHRSPEAVTSTLCFLLPIAEISMKRFFTKRVIEDDLGYGELLTLVINECPDYTPTLSSLVTSITEIDYATSRLSQPLTPEDYLCILYARIAEAYFHSDGLQGFRMDGELILNISSPINRVANIVAAMFSPEVRKTFNRKSFLRAGFQMVHKIVCHWIEPTTAGFHDGFFDELMQTSQGSDSFDPLAETSVPNVIQLMYVLSRMLSVPLRRLPKEDIQKILKTVLAQTLKDLQSLLEKLPKVANEAVRHQLSFGLNDAIKHITMSVTNQF